MHFLEITINDINEEQQDILIALLADNNFDGFETTETCLKAFANSNNVQEQAIQHIIAPFSKNFSTKIIEKQNWNAVWEANFEPVIVKNFVGIRAHFHAPIQNVQHQLVITPKMSFGTGHHATTNAVIQLMQEIDFTNKSVFDFGTGTGVLAILAEKLGATKIVAVDNDDWCIENTTENIEVNNCQNIAVQKVDTAKVKDTFNVIIANINKHIIQQNLQHLQTIAQPNAILILSGLLITDEEDILKQAQTFGFVKIKTIVNGMWVAILLKN